MRTGRRRGLRAAAATLLIGAVAALGVGCEDGRSYDQALCVLIDVSGTYADQKAEVVRILKREVLPALEPGDTLMVIRIDGDSYEKNNLEALVRLDARPSRANAQKLALAKKLDDFARHGHKAEYTDIQGAMVLGTDYLRELESGSRVMLVFSDMRQDLPAGTRRELHEEEFAHIDVVAMHVKRLDSDNANPAVFRSRLASWEQRLLDAGASGWRTLMDSTKLPEHLSSLRT
ncbi:MAG: hypothetical protein ACR2P8_12180 [Myxococcota bacterium]